MLSRVSNCYVCVLEWMWVRVLVRVVAGSRVRLHVCAMASHCVTQSVPRLNKLWLFWQTNGTSQVYDDVTHCCDELKPELILPPTMDIG
jgi:hypothetical protein